MALGFESTGSTGFWQDLAKLGAQTGSQIALSRWANAPTYTQTNTPYGSSTVVYGGAIPLPNGSGGTSPMPIVDAPGVVTGIGTGTILLIGGGLLIAMMMKGSGR